MFKFLYFLGIFQVKNIAVEDFCFRKKVNQDENNLSNTRMTGLFLDTCSGV